MQLNRELNNKKDRVKVTSLCVVLGSHFHLTRRYRHLNSGENMKARLVRLCCDFPYKSLKFEKAITLQPFLVMW